MESKREQVWVGLFVVVATGLLLFTLFAIKGVFSGVANQYVSYMPNVAGIEPGKPVRYAGMPPVGRVVSIELDPQDATRIKMVMSVDEKIPIMTDSVVEITSLGFLGDNFVQINPGKSGVRAKSGAVLPSKEYFGIAQVQEKLAALSPKIEVLVDGVNARVAELQTTIASANDLINEKNRSNVAASLEDVRGMLHDARPKVDRTLSNVEDISKQMKPLVADVKRVLGEAEKTINSLDKLVAENKGDIRESVKRMREVLDRSKSLVTQLDRTVTYNADTIDELLDNMRIISDNLKEFTDRIKSQPSSLLRSSTPQDRKPGEAPKKDN